MHGFYSPQAPKWISLFTQNMSGFGNKNLGLAIRTWFLGSSLSPVLEDNFKPTNEFLGSFTNSTLEKIKFCSVILNYNILKGPMDTQMQVIIPVHPQLSLQRFADLYLSVGICSWWLVGDWWHEASHSWALHWYAVCPVPTLCTNKHTLLHLFNTYIKCMLSKANDVLSVRMPSGYTLNSCHLCTLIVMSVKKPW